MSEELCNKSLFEKLRINSNEAYLDVRLNDEG
jgi:hypothetical protein